MATTLRLKPGAEAALRDEAERTGRSQQELVREAVDEYLGLVRKPNALPGSIERLIASGKLIPPAEPYRRVYPTLTLPAGVRTEDLLDRSDRF